MCIFSSIIITKLAKLVVILWVNRKIMVQIINFVFGNYRERCYICFDKEFREAVIVDPGASAGEELESIYGLVEKEGLSIKAIALTHCHFDHIYGVKALQERYGAPVYMHSADERLLELMQRECGRFHMPLPDTTFTRCHIASGEKIAVRGVTLEVIESPGHTPGSICFHDSAAKIIFTGDTLFAGAIGRTDFDYGDYDRLIVGIMDRLMGLDADTAVFPGHGRSTTIGEERTHNPFLQPFNEKYADTDEVEGIEINGQ